MLTIKNKKKQRGSTSNKSPKGNSTRPKIKDSVKSILENYSKLFQDDNKLILNAHNGVEITAVEDFSIISSKNQKEIAQLIHITPKTLQNYQAAKKPLPTLQSELLLKLYALYYKGLQVFGEVESFNKWLGKPAFGLYNSVPKDLLSTSTGINLVKDELIRIEYGEFA